MVQQLRGMPGVAVGLGGTWLSNWASSQTSKYLLATFAVLCAFGSSETSRLLSHPYENNGLSWPMWHSSVSIQCGPACGRNPVLELWRSWIWQECRELVTCPLEELQNFFFFSQPVCVHPTDTLPTLNWKAGSSWHVQYRSSGKGRDFSQDTWTSPCVWDVPDL